MSSLSNILIQQDILLESGTNELEILVFDVGGFRFGINVAKVREVLASREITALPESHPSVIGCFRLRSAVIPCVSLRRYLGEAEINDNQTLIVTEFNSAEIAFLVDRVERIYRTSWSNVMPVPPFVSDCRIPVYAVAPIEGRLIVLLDLESIVDGIRPVGLDTTKVDNRMNIQRESTRVLFVDDSPSARRAVKATLISNGYSQLHCVENGQLAWEWLETELTNNHNVAPVDLVISDVEMPGMDGLHLTKRIKEDSRLCHIPVILFSSILTPGNRRKAESVGANAQITKPELRRIVAVADEVLASSRRQ